LTSVLVVEAADRIKQPATLLDGDLAVTTGPSIFKLAPKPRGQVAEERAKRERCDGEPCDAAEYPARGYPDQDDRRRKDQQSPGPTELPAALELGDQESAGRPGTERDRNGSDQVLGMPQAGGVKGMCSTDAIRNSFHAPKTRLERKSSHSRKADLPVSPA
jgi:hypothetical protein